MRSMPTEADWEGRQDVDPDIAYAHWIFAGKTNDEVQVCFYKNVIERADELQWMPTTPFQYYIFGFRDFVVAGRFAFLDSSDAASSFLRLIEYKLEHQPDDILPVIDELMPAVSYVAKNQSLFEANLEIYGNFRERADRIKQLGERLIPQRASH